MNREVLPSLPNAPKPLHSNHKSLENDYGIPFRVLRSMLQRENELRLSSEIQNQYSIETIDYRGDKLSEITDNLQRQVAREFSIDEEFGMMLLRSCDLILSDSVQLNEIFNISLYRKYNRCKDGILAIGDIALPLHSKLHLVTESLDEIDIFHCVKQQVQVQPLIILAGSWS